MIKLNDRHTFLSEAIIVLEELGGQAHFNEIYKKVISRGNLDFSKAKTPDATLRRTLQINRADHPKSESNTFYSIYGVDARKGYWGLVKFAVEEQYSPDEISSDLPIIEGARKSIIVNKYERDPKARIACIEHFGAVCMVCGFDFSKVYGDKFTGKIHVHHIVPISTIGEEYQLNPIIDLVPLCPNCHYIAHLKGNKEVYSIEELQGMLKPTPASKTYESANDT